MVSGVFLWLWLLSVDIHTAVRPKHVFNRTRLAHFSVMCLSALCVVHISIQQYQILSNECMCMLYVLMTINQPPPPKLH